MSLLFKKNKKTVHTLKHRHRLAMYFIRHLQQGLASIGELWRTPMSSLLTMTVIGVSLSLPTTLHLLIKNGQQVQSHWDNAAEITLFVKPEVDQDQIKKLLRRIALYEQVSDVTYMSSTQALAEFKQLSNFGDALSYLDNNPLPNVILVIPTLQFSSPEGARNLLEKLQQQSEISFGKLDVIWLEKLSAIITLLDDTTWALGLLLLVSVLLVIANTIRLSILNRREEIEILKLVGATDDFIRRPFLYTGLWYGLIAGIIAWICASVMLLWIEGALINLASQLGSNLTLTGVTATEFLILIGLGSGLGWLGAYAAVTKHVVEIEPKN